MYMRYKRLSPVPLVETGHVSWTMLLYSVVHIAMWRVGDADLAADNYGTYGLSAYMAKKNVEIIKWAEETEQWLFIH